VTRGQSLARFLVVVLVIGATAVLLRARSGREQVPSHFDVTTFPQQIGDWRSKTFDIDPSVREILGPGDFLSRIYYTPGRPYIDFFIAYFATQRTGNAIHSPKNCLPGAGWAPVDAGTLQVPVAGASPITVNRYIIGKGLDRQLVLYWYQSHGRVVASEYWAKVYLVSDAIKSNRSDGALVRIVTPIAQNESAESAQNRAVGFAQQIYPILPQFVPR
jgi:EpsI family protein